MNQKLCNLLKLDVPPIKPPCQMVQLIDKCLSTDNDDKITLIELLRTFAESTSTDVWSKIIIYALLKILTIENFKAHNPHANFLSVFNVFDKLSIDWVEQAMQAYLLSTQINFELDLVPRFKELLFDPSRHIDNKWFLVNLFKQIHPALFRNTAEYLINQVLSEEYTLNQEAQTISLALLNILAREIKETQLQSAITFIEGNFTNKDCLVCEAATKAFTSLAQHVLTREQTENILKNHLNKLLLTPKLFNGDVELIHLLSDHFAYLSEEFISSFMDVLIERSQWEATKAFALRGACFKQIARLLPHSRRQNSLNYSSIY